MKKWQVIDLARSFSILAVMALHANKFLRTPGPFWQQYLWWHFNRNGSFGVPVFFMVSGFLITGVIAKNPGGLWKPDLRRFYAQRAGRILPLFFLTVWFGSILFFTTAGSSNLSFFYQARYSDPLFWLSLATFTFNGWFLSPKTFDFWGLHWSILWSLCIEEQFYLGYPLSLKKLGTRKNFVVFLVVIILLALVYRIGAYFYEPTNWPLQYYNPIGQFDMIGMGILLFLAHQRYSTFLSKNPSICFFLSGAGLIVFGGFYWFAANFDSRTGIYGNEIMGIGLLGFLLGGTHLRFFESKYLRLLSLPGKYCYGNYLIHPTVLYLLHPILSSLNFFASFLFFIVVTTSISSVSYHFFEVPANRLIREKFSSGR